RPLRPGEHGAGGVEHRPWSPARVHEWVDRGAGGPARHTRRPDPRAVDAVLGPLAEPARARLRPDRRCRNGRAARLLARPPPPRLRAARVPPRSGVPRLPLALL